MLLQRSTDGIQKYSKILQRTREIIQVLDNLRHAIHIIPLYSSSHRLLMLEPYVGIGMQSKKVRRSTKGLSSTLSYSQSPDL